MMAYNDLLLLHPMNNIRLFWYGGVRVTRVASTFDLVP
jgi:hypothetical protein